VQQRIWLSAAVLGLLSAGCSQGLEGVGAGVSPGSDAQRCVSLASRMGLNLQACPTSHFVLVSSSDGASAPALGQFLDQVVDRFYTSFSQAGFSPHPLSDRLICVCLDSYRDLDAYGREADGTEASWMDGYYSYRTNRIAVVRVGGGGRGQGAGPAPGSAGSKAAFSPSSSGLAGGGGLNLTTVTHELSHQLAFNSGLQRRDAIYPFWLTEGLATNFEADSSGSYGLAGQASRYRSRLVDVKARGKLLTLDHFAGTIDAPVGHDQEIRDAYAQAWGLFSYLLQHRREQLRAYMSDLASPLAPHQDAQSLHRRFVETFGPAEKLDGEFRAFVDELGRS
jgi:hypothetical protein